MWTRVVRTEYIVQEYEQINSRWYDIDSYDNIDQALTLYQQGHVIDRKRRIIQVTDIEVNTDTMSQRTTVSNIIKEC